MLSMLWRRRASSVGIGAGRSLTPAILGAPPAPRPHGPLLTSTWDDSSHSSDSPLPSRDRPEQGDTTGRAATGRELPHAAGRVVETRTVRAYPGARPRADARPRRSVSAASGRPSTRRRRAPADGPRRRPDRRSHEGARRDP